MEMEFRTETNPAAPPALAPAAPPFKGAAQIPLLQPLLSRAAFERLSEMKGITAVQVGIGLKDRQGLSRAIPYDVLGMLLVADWARRQAAPGGNVDILVADKHAKEAGCPANEVDRQAGELRRTLQTASEVLDIPSRVVLASEMAASESYARHLSRVSEEFRDREDGISAYTIRELADMSYLADDAGARIKVGWAATDSPERARAGHFDEPYYDALFQQHLNGSLAFLYIQPGLRLDHRALRAAPYLEREPEARIVLAPGEDVQRKFTLAEERGEGEAAKAYRKLLNAIARTARYVTGLDLKGTIEERTQQLVNLIVG